TARGAEGRRPRRPPPRRDRPMVGPPRPLSLLPGPPGGRPAIRRTAVNGAVLLPWTGRPPSQPTEVIAHMSDQQPEEYQGLVAAAPSAAAPAFGHVEESPSAPTETAPLPGEAPIECLPVPVRPACSNAECA